MSIAPNSAECPQDLIAGAITVIEGDALQGLAELDRLLAIYGLDPRLHFLRGSVLAGLRRYSEADLAMQTAVNLAPGFHIARFQWGLLKLTSGDAADAAEIWKPLSQLDLDHPLRLFAEGLQSLARGETSAASAAIRRGMARNGENQPLNRDMQLILDMLCHEQGVGLEPSHVAHELFRHLSGVKTRH